MDLIICRGIPASGKTTWSRAYCLTTGAVRVNRDDIRMQLFGVEFGCDEVVVTKVEQAMITAALKAGKSVVVDATNLNHRFIKPLIKLGQRYGADVSVKQFDVDLDVALERNANRDRKVPEDVIRDMHRRLKSSGPVVIEPQVREPYVAPNSGARAIICDIDGTLAKMSGRSPYEWHRVGEDKLVDAVSLALSMFRQNGHNIILMSGRDSECRTITEAWLAENEVSYDYLYMRAAGDMRLDDIVKYELFDEHVRDYFVVDLVLDDRDQVVELWRSLGLTCWQVAWGDF